MAEGVYFIAEQHGDVMTARSARLMIG